MARRTERTLTWLLAALAAVPAVSLRAQDNSRFVVLVPDFMPTEGAPRRFGETAAESLRQLVSSMLTHEAIPRRELERSLKAYKINREDLDCVRTRQLAGELGAKVALCASYAAQGDRFLVTASFWDIASGESFQVPTLAFNPDQGEAAARHVFGEFDRYTEQIRADGICSEYAASRQWQAALENCDRALALNPSAVGTRYRRAWILYQTDRAPEALEELRWVLAADEMHRDALQLAGYLAATTGLDDEALRYYERYLELDPGNAAVRMKIAYELAQAGDPAGAAHLIEAGLDADPGNVDLWEQLGGFAFAAGSRIQEPGEPGDAGALAPEAARYFRQAVDAYTRVYEARGAATPSTALRSIVGGLVRLGEGEQAVAMAERAVATHGEDAGVWSAYADALQRAGRLPDAIGALDRVARLDPAYPNVWLRQAKWLIDAGRAQDAVAVLKRVAASDASQADAAGRLILADAYAKGIQPKRWDLATGELTAARDIPNMSVDTRRQIDFWLGWSVFQDAIERQDARTLDSAKATLPLFQRARELFGTVGDYPASVGVNLQQLLENVGTYIEIQESIIRRGG